MEDAYYLEVYVPMSSKWTIAYIKKAGITEDNQHAEISTTFPHQAATPKQQMLKWRHHTTKWSTKSNADDRLHQRRDKQDNWLTDWVDNNRLYIANKTSECVRVTRKEREREIVNEEAQQ